MTAVLAFCIVGPVIVVVDPTESTIMNWSIHMKTLNGRLVTSPNRQSSLHAVIIIIIIIIIVTGMRHPLHFHDEKKDNETENRRNSTRDSHSNCKVSFEKDGALSLSLSVCVSLCPEHWRRQRVDFFFSFWFRITWPNWNRNTNAVLVLPFKLPFRPQTGDDSL